MCPSTVSLTAGPAGGLARVGRAGRAADRRTRLGHRTLLLAAHRHDGRICRTGSDVSGLLLTLTGRRGE